MSSTFRRIRSHMQHMRTNRDWKFFKPMYPTTLVKKQIPALPSDVRVTLKPFKANSLYLKGFEGRLLILSARMTTLFKMERIELIKEQAEDLRPYVERLIVEAMKHGDCHRPTMELADFWLQEKQLIHKLFKVIVPRYVDYTESFTSIYRLAPRYDDNANSKRTDGASWRMYRERAVLELKGNPLPPLRPPKLTNKNFLTNVLLNAARKANEKSQNHKDRDETEV